MFNFNHLYYFYVTARIRSVTAAARALQISQPALSTQLKTLEGRLDKQLFRRAGSRIELTTDGEIAYSYCQRMFEVAEEFREFLTHTHGEKNHVLRVGVCDELPAPFIADFLSAILKNSSEPQKPTLSLLSFPHKTLIEKLCEGHLDICLSNRVSQGTPLNILAAAQMPVSLILSATPSATHRPLSSLQNLDFAEVFQYLKGGLVLPSENVSFRREIELFLHQHRIQREVVFEADYLSYVIRAITEGVGFGFLPTPYVSREIQAGRLVSIGPKKGWWQHSIILMTPLSKTSDALIGQIQKAILAL